MKNYNDTLHIVGGLLTQDAGFYRTVVSNNVLRNEYLYEMVFAESILVNEDGDIYVGGYEEDSQAVLTKLGDNTCTERYFLASKSFIKEIIEYQNKIYLVIFSLI